MDPARRQFIESLHAAPARCVLALTGGGATAAADLLTVPGASRTVLEVLVPYHEAALTDFLAHRPDQFCSAETSQEMAERAYDRAVRLAPGEPVVGVGVTASLATDRPKHGDHRFNLTTQTADRRTTVSLTLAKGQRDRAGEEAVLAAVLLNSLAEAFGVTERLPVPLLPGESPAVETVPASDPLTRFLRGELTAVCQELDGRWTADHAKPAALLSGSFNPLHDGHLGLAEVARRRLRVPVAFELSVRNVDKPELSPAEVRRRAAQFVGRAPLWLTRAPTFLEKAELFPGCTFVVGADTAERIVAPRYYGDDEARRTAALERLRECGCRFLVAGRAGADGAFVELEQVAVPDRHRDLFMGLSAGEFRVDRSSTELRAGRGGL
jgi:hypothetical protein